MHPAVTTPGPPPAARGVGRTLAAWAPWLLAGAPLAFGALMLAHPTGDSSLSATVAANTTPWLVVHFGAAVLFPVMAAVVWRMLHGVPGVAARVARAALPVFAVFYGVFETIVGIATGVLGQGDASNQAVAAAIDRMAAHPVVGELGVFNSIGSIAWIVALCAAGVALNRAGSRRGVLVLLGVAALMVQHVPPVGPLALACLGAAAFLIERGRRAPAPAGATSRRAAGGALASPSGVSATGRFE